MSEYTWDTLVGAQSVREFVGNCDPTKHLDIEVDYYADFVVRNLGQQSQDNGERERLANALMSHLSAELGRYGPAHDLTVRQYEALYEKARREEE